MLLIEFFCTYILLAKICSIWKAQWKHSYLPCWFAGNGLAPITNKYIKNNVCTRDELFQRSREGSFGVYFPSCEATREMKTKITLESAYIIVFLTRHKESINEDKKHDLYTSSPCLTRSVFVLLPIWLIVRSWQKINPGPIFGCQLLEANVI